MTPRPLEPGFVWITRHAQVRIREHYPNAGVPWCTELLRQSDPIDGVSVAGLLHRPLERASDRYFLAPDRRGVFVVAERPDNMDPTETRRTLITYIRLVPSQVEIAERLWPVAKEAA